MGPCDDCAPQVLARRDFLLPSCSIFLVLSYLIILTPPRALLRDRRACALLSSAFAGNMLFDELKNLGKELDTKSYTHQHDDVILSLISTIDQLNQERRELHESLEVTTIAGSKMRFALQTLPNKYNEHMKDAVMRARSKSDRIIKEKHLELEISLTETREAEVTFKKLIIENELLKPQSQEAKKQHDNTISDLNAQLSEQSEDRIFLQETEEATAAVEREIDEIATGIENLTEDIRIHKKQRDEERAEVVHDTEEVEKVLKDVELVNADLKRLDDDNETKMFEAALKRDHLIKSLKGQQIFNKSLMAERLGLEGYLEKKTPENEKLRHERDYVVAAEERMTQEHDGKVSFIDSQLILAAKRQKEAEQRSKELQSRHTTAEKKRSEMKLAEERVLAYKKEKDEICTSVRKKLNDYETSVSNLYLQKKELENRGEKLKIRNDSTIAQMRKKSKNLANDTESEREEKQKFMKLKEESEEALRSYQQESSKYSDGTTRKISTARNDYKSCVEKNHMMIRETRLNRRKNEELSKEYDLLKKRTTREKEELLMNVERSLDQIDSLKAENRKNSLRREETSSTLHELRIEAEKERGNYDDAKNLLIETRKQERNLLKEKEDTEMKIEYTKKTIETSKVEMEDLRSKTADQLGSHREEQAKSDINIYNLVHLNEKMSNGNSAFVKAMDQYHEDVEKLVAKISKYENVDSAALREAVESNKTEMWKLFYDSVRMKSDSAQKEEVVITKMRDLHEDVDQRNDKTGSILADISFHLTDYTRFVEDVKSRRADDGEKSLF